MLGQDGDELIAAAFKKIEETFTADVLWDWLLFGEGFPALPMLNGTPRQERVIGSLPAKRGAKGRLTRLVKTLRSAAITVGGSVERLHGHITYPVRQALIHPLLRLRLSLRSPPSSPGKPAAPRRSTNRCDGSRPPPTGR